MIEQRLVLLRKIVRKNSKYVAEQLIENHNASICIICGTSKNLTKEHVIPKWVFDNNQKKNFVTNINDISQSYSKTTLPACAHCNSYVLGVLECYLETIFTQKNLAINYFSNNEKEKIVLWLELIDYKFQALNLRRKFRKPQNGEYVPYLADIPIGIMQKMDTSPSKIFSNFRQALKKLGVKSKSDKVNSLIIFETSNESFHFFHKVNEFIFIELPNKKVALFYFIGQSFDDDREAYESAMEIIKAVY
ncbi:MAG: hypothetical protein NTW85_07325 [Methylococcales bacterium]|nr:hypothetical protein [Methylococcales bacterium]